MFSAADVIFVNIKIIYIKIIYIKIIFANIQIIYTNNKITSEMPKITAKESFDSLCDYFKVVAQKCQAITQNAEFCTSSIECDGISVPDC